MAKLMIVVVVMAVVSAAVIPVYGEDCTFLPTTGDWNSAANWSCTGGEDIPDADDEATIPSGKTCNVNVTTATVDHFYVPGTLNIQAGKKLTVDGSDFSTSHVGGTLNLEGSGSELAFVDNDQTISSIEGFGKLVGMNDSAQITVALDITLKNSGFFVIEGNLKITGNGTFDNQGNVRANVNGTLEVSTAGLKDTSGGKFEVSGGNGAVLKFSTTGAATPVLAGEFEVSAGVLDIDSSLVTTGKLTQTGGKIDVADGKVAGFGIVLP